MALATIATGVLAAAPASWAQPVSGNSKMIGMSNSATGPQKILVIPIVDKNFNYNPANRQITDANFPMHPGLHKQIEDQYAVVKDFWDKGSYGILDINANVSKCFYRTASAFPNANEAPFQTAHLQSIPLQFIAPSFGVAFQKLVLEYVADPAQPPRRVEFASDGMPIVDPDVLITLLRAQLGAAATDLEVNFVGTRGAVSTGSLVFQIIETRTFVGSRITVHADTPAGSRINLGLPQPTMRATTHNPMRLIVSTDGAVIPGRFGNRAGTSLNFFFSGAGSIGSFFSWNLTNTDGTPLNQSCRPNCPVWNNVPELKLVVRPGTSRPNDIRTVMLNGRTEFEYEMGTNEMPGTVFNTFQASGASDGTLKTLGLAQRKTQQGTALGRNITRDSPTLTREALQAFLNVEMVDDLACLPWGELRNDINLASPAAAKTAIDNYLGQFNAIHAFLLTNTNAIRDNASFTWLTSTLSKGGNSMPYQILSPVAAMEIDSGAPVIAHEVGHNIGSEDGSQGFPDLYDNSNTWHMRPSDYHPDLTFPGKWDVMADHSEFAFPGAFIRETFGGWIGSGHGDIVRVNQGQTRTFVLTPVEQSKSAYDASLPGQMHPIAKMLVLKLGDDNQMNPRTPTHYIAIENRQPFADNASPPHFNQALPSGGGVHVTDNLSQLHIHGALAKPIARNFSQTLTPKVGGGFPDRDGSPVPVMGSLDLANTFPGYPGITVEHLGMVDGPTPTSPKSAIVKVTYPMAKQVDGAIEAWDPKKSATRAIWFTRATSNTPPSNPPVPSQVGNVNVPVVIRGYDKSKNGDKPLNWIHVKVDNPGSFDLTQVRVKLTINSPGGMGDPANWQPLDETPMGQGVDIPAGQSRVLSFGWSPTENLAAKGHTCIAAEVFDWNAEGQGLVGDVNPHNNVSQENVFEMTVVSGSPWHDVPFELQVHNSYNHDVEVALEPEGLPAGYEVNMESWTAHMPGNTSRLFKGTLKWDSIQIPTPPNQNANDPFWAVCNPPPVIFSTTSTPPPPPPHCQKTWGMRAYAMIGDYRIPIGSVSFETQGRPVATVTATTSVGPNGAIVVTGTINPPSTDQTVRVVVRHPSGAIDYVDVPTSPTGTFTHTTPQRENGPVQVGVELPRGGGPYAPTGVQDHMLGCSFVPDKLTATTCVDGPSQVNLGSIPAGCRAEIRSVDGNNLSSPMVLTSGIVTLRPGRYVVHWTATNSALASKVSAPQTITVVANDPSLCCGTGQRAIFGNDQANTFTFTDDQAYCVMSRGGQDSVTTPARNDSLFGGADSDMLHSGAGNDFLVGGEGADNLSCKGNMQAHGGPGADSLSANQGKASVMYGGAGADQLVGSPEADTLYPGSGANNTTAGGGNDKIVILDACEITSGAFIDGGTGTDTLVSPVSLTQLRALGVTVVSIETVQVTSKDAHLSDCFPRPPAPAPGCGVLPDWLAGTSYAPGARVENNLKVYECKPAPANGWCGQVGYEPGASASWQQAWLEIGPCQ